MSSGSNNEPLIKSRLWADDSPIVSEASNFTVPRFKDDRWFIPAVTNKSKGELTIDFGRLFPDPVRNLTAKELVMHRMHTKRVGGTASKSKNSVGWRTVMDDTRQLVKLYEFMDDKGIDKLSQLTQEHLDVYEGRLRGRTARYKTKRLAIVLNLYGANADLTADTISFLPWNGAELARRFGRLPRVENTTPRIPELVVRGLIQWSMHYLDTFSDDVITAVFLHEFGKYHKEKRSKFRGIKRISLNDKLGARALVEFSRVGPTNREGTDDTVGAGFKRLPQRIMRQLRAVDPEADVPPVYIPRSLAKPRGIRRAWRPQMRVDDVSIEARNLMAACYIICAYLSGMRDSEVQSLRPGSLSKLMDKDGNVIRHYVTSIQYKGAKLGGIERAWVVTEQVAKAISVAERLGAAERLETGSKLLFVFPNRTAAGNTPALKKNINIYISQFISHINNFLAPRFKSNAYPRIIMGDFGPITTRMFRRTVAWHIANRPFGIVAGMLQYGHMSIQVFEGYAGTSASGFKAEVEAEKALARMADVRLYYDEHRQGKKLAGPASSQLGIEFDHIEKESLKIKAEVVTDDRRIDGMLKHLATQLFPGILNDCFFNAKRAKCAPSDINAEFDVPAGIDCNPYECANSCFHGKHLPAWQRALGVLEEMASKNWIHDGQKAALDYKRIQYHTVINAIEEAQNGGA